MQITRSESWLSTILKVSPKALKFNHREKWYISDSQDVCRRWSVFRRKSNLAKNHQFLSVLSFWPFRSPETFFYASVLIAGSNAFQFLSLYSLLFLCDSTTRFSIMTSRQTVSTRCIIRIAKRNQLSMVSSFSRMIWKRWYFEDSKSAIDRSFLWKAKGEASLGECYARMYACS